ncbi:ectonucleoside triphosphate diphosphohydrolase 8 isoform X3 [Trachypithecus francoisi]|uniref:ectonucleoside triphosphate diphosphohydrolase 8 isoform X3 n=1 Tax=Trachypithecus francoisi TaxID=54180 RepID=UPI00141B7EF2|nr:ectonucleoside triphosphate diphosphohydrolase 8 isoform X3 [Trachypithecus francoisi]
MPRGCRRLLPRPGPGPSGSPDSDLPGPSGAGGKVRAGALRAAAGGAGRGPAVLPFAAPGFSSASLSCLPPPGGGATLGAGTDPRVGDAGRPWAGDPRVEGAGRPWALTSVCGPWSQVHSVSLEAVTVPPLPPQLSWTQGQGEAGRQVRRTQTRLSTASSFLLREVGSQPSLASCLMRAPPTRPCSCISGRRTRRMALVWSARPWPARWKAGESLQGCLEEALVLIPEAQHRKTPMFLGATAGMRLLRQKNSSQARDIFAAVTQVLGRSPVDFWGAEVLGGQDEGAFGWITVNYGLGTLVKYSFTGEWIQPPEETLVGALDMGGASTQITFVPGGPILDKSTQADFRLYGSNYSVYTHSYLCFGRDQMLSRLLVGLVQAFSNFYYTFHFLNLTSGQSLSTVNTTIWEFCQRPWKLVETSYPGQDRWLPDYCASGLYILTLLHEGYRFSEETWPSLEFRKQAGGVDIGWTLGYMLNLTGMIPADAPAQLWAVSYGVWVAKVVFMVLTLVAVVGAALVQLFWLQD